MTVTGVILIFQAKYERQHREDLSKKGELGKREDIGSRLGFHFKLTKKESVQKLQVDEDPELKKMAFDWKSGGEVSSESKAEEKLKQQEGEKGDAATRAEKGDADGPLRDQATNEVVAKAKKTAGPLKKSGRNATKAGSSSDKPVSSAKKKVSSAKKAVSSAKKAVSSAKKAGPSAKKAGPSAKNAGTSAKNAGTSARNAGLSAKNASPSVKRKGSPDKKNIDKRKRIASPESDNVTGSSKLNQQVKPNKLYVCFYP